MKRFTALFLALALLMALPLAAGAEEETLSFTSTWVKGLFNNGSAEEWFGSGPLRAMVATATILDYASKVDSDYISKVDWSNTYVANAGGTLVVSVIKNTGGNTIFFLGEDTVIYQNDSSSASAVTSTFEQLGWTYYRNTLDDMLTVSNYLSDSDK